MTALKSICAGSLALARIKLNGLQKGDTVYINTNTAPTPSGEHIMFARVNWVSKDGKEFTTHENEPYFGYNRFKFTDIVG